MLNNNGDCVYGYLFYLKELQNIKQDGTFIQSAGAGNINYCKMSFDKNNYEIEKLAVCDSYKYEIEGEPVTKDAFDNYIEKQNIKKDVEWISISE